eukprot:1582246-Rhodomonas_salina.1
MITVAKALGHAVDISQVAARHAKHPFAAQALPEPLCCEHLWRFRGVSGLGIPDFISESAAGGEAGRPGARPLQRQAEPALISLRPL